MDLTITKKSLLPILAAANALADRKSSMPILANVLLTAKDEQLQCFATDLYFGVTSKAEAKTKKSGSIAVRSRDIHALVAKFPEGEIRISTDKSGNALVHAGKSKFKLPAMPGEDFPELPAPGDAEFVEFDRSELEQAIRHVDYAASKDDTRAHLCGVKLESDGKTVRLVTTDGHRLSKSEFESTAGPLEMLVPLKGISELKRLCEDAKKAGEALVSVARGGGYAFFRSQRSQLSARLSDDQFPPYVKVIPSSHQRRMVVARELLADAVTRVALVASDKSSGIRLVLKPGSLTIESENPDVGEGSEELDVDFAGEPLKVGVNARYLTETLSSLSDDEVALELGGELDPVVVRPLVSNVTAVIMPMRV